jgi:shikimate kinase
MPGQPDNPYFNINPIRDVEMLFGRMPELRRLYSAIVNHQNISLVGPRKIGKTSLLQCLGAEELQRSFASDLSRHIMVLIDLKAHLKKSEDEFFNAVNRRILAQSPAHLNLELAAEGGAEAFDSLLEQIKAAHFHTVLLMDSFDSITRNEELKEEFFSFLRAQVDMGKVSYVTASQASLDTVKHEGSPLFTMFGVCKLDLFDYTEALDLITIPAQRVGFPFSEEETRWLLLYGGYHPFVLQRLCFALFEEKVQQNGRGVDLKQTARLVYDELRPHFEKIWESLGASQRAQIQNEIRLAGAKKGELEEPNAGILFRSFVVKKHQQPSSYLDALTPETLAEILDNVNDARFLDECCLRQWHIVARRTNGQEVSATERGMAVRKALSDAHERMRGAGVRSSTAEDWRFYNILSYTYFKPPYRMTKDQIAANLGISTRTYYRERPEAIEALCRVLLDIEAGTGKEE